MDTMIKHSGFFHLIKKSDGTNNSIIVKERLKSDREPSINNKDNRTTKTESHNFSLAAIYKCMN